MSGRVTGPARGASEDAVRRVVAAIPDPEIPVLTLEDLGILREVSVDREGRVSVAITPTYLGCPALDAMRDEIGARLREHGWHEVVVRTVLSPAWSTDWMSAEGRRKLREHGIAPPPDCAEGPVPVTLHSRCPRCGSIDTHEVSRFGSTACKALWVCDSCREPFDHFKAF